MKLKTFDINDLPGGRGCHLYSKTKIQSILEEFIANGARCCEVENYPHKSAQICATTLKHSAERYGYYQIKVIRRGERVFLILEDEK